MTVVMLVLALISTAASVIGMIVAFAIAQEQFQFYQDAKYWHHFNRTAIEKTAERDEKFSKEVKHSFYNSRKRDTTLRAKLTELVSGNRLEITGSDGGKTAALVLPKKGK